MKSEPMWPLIEKAHTYASENADIYHAYDDGQKAMLKRCIAAFNDWLKEQKPIVLPERKEFNHPHCVYGNCIECMGIEKWNACLNDFLRLNPQIRRPQ